MISFGLTTVFGCALVLGGAHVLDPARLCSTLVVGYAVFVFMPVVMAGSLMAVCLPLTVFVVVVEALFSWGRPSGARELVGEILALPGAVVPGYVRALRGVRSARLWGLVAGGFAGTVLLGVGLAQGFAFG